MKYQEYIYALNEDSYLLCERYKWFLENLVKSESRFMSVKQALYDS